MLTIPAKIKPPPAYKPKVEVKEEVEGMPRNTVPIHIKRAPTIIALASPGICPFIRSRLSCNNLLTLKYKKTSVN
jgi:hypothetical protein